MRRGNNVAIWTSFKILVPISGASFWGCLTAAQYRSGIPFFYVYDHATGSCICDRFTGRCFCSSGVYMRAWLGGSEWCHPIYTSTSYSSDAIWFGTWDKSYHDNYIQFFKKVIILIELQVEQDILSSIILKDTM